MSKFKVGDRVRAVNGDHPTDIYYSYTGTVVDPHGQEPWYVHVQRDDGMEGNGYHGSWLASEDKLELLVDGPDQSCLPKSKPKHVMGLDPEEFDWDAHKTFIKGL
jgi:hypothetical protein